jgi:hypothetical protein
MTGSPELRALGACAALLLAAAAAAEPPPQGRCPTLQGRPGEEALLDATPALLREGMVLGAEDVLRLRELIPEEIWSQRSEFFHPGMRMEIGPCHRRYPVADFYARATLELSGRARVDEDGNLHDYGAGLPFRPQEIDPAAPDAGVRWAWNLAYRYRGGGPRGEFRLVELPGRLGGPQTYQGTFFLLQTGHRSDLAESGWAVPEAKRAVFVAGGRFSEPFDARHLAWRQIRPAETERDAGEPDDTFVYVPTMRKMRRAATAWVEGMFTPRYRASGDAGGGGILVGGGDAYRPGGGLPGGAIQPSAAASIQSAEDIGRGFASLLLRPNAWSWRLVGEREVLAPLNTTRPCFPAEPDRNFGRSGLSLASDRWEIRQAAVLEGSAKKSGGAFEQIAIYVDTQTQQPLYLFTRKRSGRLVDLTIPAHRFSGDVAGYPRFPSGHEALVFDPVATVSYSALDGSGWRRESCEVRSTPVSDSDVRRYTSSAFLERGN